MPLLVSRVLLKLSFIWSLFLQKGVIGETKHSLKHEKNIIRDIWATRFSAQWVSHSKALRPRKLRVSPLKYFTRAPSKWGYIISALLSLVGGDFIVFAIGLCPIAQFISAPPPLVRMDFSEKWATFACYTCSSLFFLRYPMLAEYRMCEHFLKNLKNYKDTTDGFAVSDTGIFRAARTFLPLF